MAEEHHSLIPFSPNSDPGETEPAPDTRSEVSAISRRSQSVRSSADRAEYSEVPAHDADEVRDAHDIQNHAVMEASPGLHGQGSTKSESGPLNSTTARPHSKGRFSLMWWIEALACFSSIAALLTLFGILFAYKNRPSPHWPRWISLNTIVSICIVVLKTSILLVLTEGIGQLKWSWFTCNDRPLEHMQMWDDATRGPVGASVLLWRLHGRNLLASLGALIVVLTLAVDPFAQQIVHYTDCDVTVPALAVIPRANSYNGQGNQDGPLSNAVTPAEQAAVNRGVFQPNPYTTFVCPTGNCTWSSEYSTIAMCSSCTNITSQLKVVQNVRMQETITDVKGSDSSNRTESEYLGYVLKTSVSDGISVSVTSTPYSTGAFNDLEWEYAAMGPSPDGDIDFITAAKPQNICNDTATAARWPCSGPQGTRCSFQPCVKRFNASIELGRLTEHLIDTSTEWGQASFGKAKAMLDIKCLNDIERRSLRDLGYVFNDEGRYLAYNLSLDSDPGWQGIPNDTFPTSMQLHNCLYSVSAIWQNSIMPYFADVLNGTVMGYMPRTVMPQGLFWGPQTVQSIFNFGNVTFESIEDTLNNISVSLTNYMRENGDPNYYAGINESNPVYSIPAAGTVQQTKICIQVRWGWLAYPTTLVLLTLIFLILLLMETWPSASKPRIWKSSPLALLYHGLGFDVTKTMEQSELQELDGMKRIAKSTSVKLCASDSGLVQLNVSRKSADELI